MASFTSSATSSTWPRRMCACGHGPCIVKISRSTKNPGRPYFVCPRPVVSDPIFTDHNCAVREAIETLRRNNVNAFVLDLRDNSGGLFPEGIEIAKIWLEKGVIVYICDSQGVRDIYDTDGSNAIAAREPLAVLVNKGTASASEILAGALKDNKRAVLFGEPTYGKGKIQSVFELSDGSGLAVTVARYETPAHTDIDKSLPVNWSRYEAYRPFCPSNFPLIL
ncbi:hypothetical protein TEA_017768 [Camellia sinensis var. sinensis]|uniref:Tail specific protease domain-containing protein n=1 Tax=Camellia sinensis var. sinensis TaxID=542762 RepID=A0A4S4DNU0_CAMSN|nr:hypothetical protein TEA_017768 [Camellia sinensis var. sinensis]